MPKSYKNLYYKIYAFENLLLAYYRARRGKRSKSPVGRFEYNLEGELWKLHYELMNKTYTPGKYYNFYIREHKKRLITAAPFRDRVVHHAILQVIEPIFERMFIYNSYACRIGKGTQRAVKRFQEFSRKNRYVLRMDIEKFYPSVDHQILMEIISRWIKDGDVLWLISLILDSGVGILDNEYRVHYYRGDNLFTPFERKKGLPIGNLTSQFFANVYLNQMDHFIKEVLRVKYYIRYMDDFCVFSDSKKYLWKVKEKIEDFLQGLRLSLNYGRVRVFPVDVGVEFLGYRIWPSHIKVRKKTVYRYTKRLKRLVLRWKRREIHLEKVRQSLYAWFGFVNFANSYNLKKIVMRKTFLHAFSR